MIKGTLLKLFFILYLIYLSSLSTNDQIYFSTRCFGVCVINTYDFKPSQSEFIILHTKICILGKYLNVDHTLFILVLYLYLILREMIFYLEKNILFPVGNTCVLTSFWFHNHYGCFPNLGLIGLMICIAIHTFTLYFIYYWRDIWLWYI